MYETCPKCEYTRKSTDSGDPGTCPACGLIFAKYMKQKFAVAPTAAADESIDEEVSILKRVLSMVLYVEPKTDPVIFYGRLILFVLFVIWGIRFIMMDYTLNPPPIGESFMHRINLVFHEAGHVFFRPLGWFMTILGGTLGQLIMPLVVTLVFVFKNHDNFAASIGLWWLGQSFMDTAPYINDALKQELILLGGRTGADAPGNHDWNNILGELNMLEKCYQFAALADKAGIMLMITAFLWGGYILKQQYANTRS